MKRVKTEFKAEPYETPTKKLKSQLEKSSQVSQVITLSRKWFRQDPDFRVLATSGPAHMPHFTFGVYIRDILLERGEGYTKKSAKADAVSNLMDKLLDFNEHLDLAKSHPVKQRKVLQSLALKRESEVIDLTAIAPTALLKDR